jgi:hypothetical protein
LQTVCEKTEEGEVKAVYEATEQGQITMKGQVEKEWHELLAIVHAHLEQHGQPGSWE